MAKSEKNVLRGYDLDDPKQRAELTEIVTQQVQEGIPLKTALGLSEQDLEQVYAVAYGKYQQGAYKDAVQLFRYLVSLDPETYKFVLGLAASHHKLKEYLAAGNLYVLASLRSPSDPVPYFHAADCYLRLDDKELAKSALEICITHCTSEEAAHIKERAQLILNAIEGKSPPKKKKPKKK